MDTVSIVKLIKIVEINKIMDVHLKTSIYIVLYKYIKYIYVKENVYNCKDLIDF